MVAELLIYELVGVAIELNSIYSIDALDLYWIRGLMYYIFVEQLDL